MRATEHVERRFNRWSIVLSVLLHGFICTVVILMPSPSPNSAVQEDAINVEIVTSPLPNAQERPAQPPAPRDDLLPSPAQPIISPPSKPDTSPAVAPPQALRQKNEPTFVKPSQMLSEDVLADHRSSQARDALRQLAPADQIEQLCNLEAMAQIGAWNKELQPDRIVAYAMADTKMSGNDFVAEGAAVHSEHDWYSLRFKCQLTSDRKKVVAFEFMLGASIPRNQWVEHNLPYEDEQFD